MDLKISTLRIGDIHYKNIPPATLKWIEENAEVTYKDQVARENIYNLEGTMEAIQYDEMEAPGGILDDLKKIQRGLNKNICSFLRITYS